MNQTLEQILARERVIFWQSFAIIMTIPAGLLVAAKLAGLL